MERHGRQERVRRDDEMPSGHENAERAKGEHSKEAVELGDVVLGQYRESRERLPLDAVEGRGDAPDAAAAAAPLPQVRPAVLDQPVGRVRDDGLDRAGASLREPVNSFIKHIHGAIGEVAAELVAGADEVCPVLVDEVFQALAPRRIARGVLAFPRCVHCLAHSRSDTTAKDASSPESEASLAPFDHAPRQVAHKIL